MNGWAGPIYPACCVPVILFVFYGFPDAEPLGLPFGSASKGSVNCL